MKKALVFMGALLFLVAPAAVFADSFLGPIVPQNIQDGGPYLQACHLVQLFDSALKFAVGFATLVATVMFVYAGFLYVTAAANQDNLNKAKTVFGNVFIGFVIVLVAWLVVDLIMSVFVNEKEVGPWNRIECVKVEDRTPYYPRGGAIDSSLPGNPDADTCPTCENIKSLNCKNPSSCSANDQMRAKIDAYAAELGDKASETIVTEAGPNTTLLHNQQDRYATGNTADIGCRNAGRSSSGGCTSDWVKRNLDAWSKAGGSRAVYETTSQAEADRLIRDGVDASKIKVFPDCSTGASPCATGSHISIYN